MQQTALNLIAIGVFVVTMSSLLTPVLPISPLIPAGFTLTVLSLTTVDTFAWQGRGVNILLDWVAGFSPEHRERIVHHEAGHFLVAYFLGIPISGYTLSAWEAWRQGYTGLGGVVFQTEDLSERAIPPSEIRLVLDRFCTVWMAGIAAETLVYKEAQGGVEDRQKVQAALVTFGRPSSEAQTKERWAQIQATTMLQKYWQAYEALVEAMSTRASVNECYQAIQKYCQEEKVSS